MKHLLLPVGVVVVLGALGLFLLASPKAEPAPAPRLSGVAQPWLDIGGVRYWTAAMDMRSASSTVCSLQSPAATSTLAFASASFTAGVAYATSYELGTADTAFATSTVIGRMQLAAGTNVMGHVVATSTALNTTLVDGVMRPNQWVNFKVATATASSLYNPTGNCKAVWTQVY